MEQRNVAEKMVCCLPTAFAFVLVVNVSSAGGLLDEKVYCILVNKNDVIKTCLTMVKQTIILTLIPTCTLIILLNVLVHFISIKKQLSLLKLKQDYNYD